MRAEDGNRHFCLGSHPGDTGRRLDPEYPGQLCVLLSPHHTQTKEGPHEESLYIQCYVDDLFIIATHDDWLSLYHKITSDLKRSWEVEDEGKISDLLNVEIADEDGYIKLSQTVYISQLMDTYAPNGKPTSYPLKSHPPSRVPACTHLPQLVLDATTGQDASDIEPELLRAYQSLVGTLLYTSVNTPDPMWFMR